MRRASYLLFVIILLIIWTGVTGAAEKDYVNFIPEKIKGKQMVALRQIGEYFDWQLTFVNPSKDIYIRSEQGLYLLNTGEGLMAGSGLQEKPLINGGRTYITPEDAGEIIRVVREDDQMDVLLTYLTTDKSSCRAGEEITATIRIINLGEEPVNLKYASGKLYDLYLLRDGEEIWRWSEGRYFTMALIKEELGPGKKLVYDVEVPTDRLDPGKYILTGIIATEQPMELNEVELEIIET